MARRGSTDTVVLGERRRLRLEAMVARPTTAQRVVVRAKIVLAAWRGRSKAAIARALGISVDTVRKWRHRFVRDGMPGPPHDRPRPGRPAIYGLDAQSLIVATVTGQAPQVDSHWTHRLLAHHLAKPLGISASHIGRILAHWTSNRTGSVGG
jgi:transposase